MPIRLNISMSNINVTNEELQSLMDSSNSYSDILRKLGVSSSNGGNYRTLIKRIKDNNLSTSLLDSNRTKSGFTQRRSNKLSDDEIFTENSSYFNRGNMKLKLVNEYNFKYECSDCKIGDTYNDKPITLQLDHINGINDDNRLENLRFLCPNCHSQTDTFSGKKCDKSRRVSTITSTKSLKYCSCGKLIQSTSDSCIDCISPNYKIIWPSIEEMTKLVWDIPTTKLAINLGVSDVAIKNFCKRNNIPKPPRGFWTKKKDLSKME